jgi:hypothetical protein
MSVNREAVACYRLYAANCVELAEGVADPDRRVFLLAMAIDWLKLADQAEKEGEAGHGSAAIDANSRHEQPAGNTTPDTAI